MQQGVERGAFVRRGGMSLLILNDICTHNGAQVVPGKTFARCARCVGPIMQTYCGRSHGLTDRVINNSVWLRTWKLSFAVRTRSFKEGVRSCSCLDATSRQATLVSGSSLRMTPYSQSNDVSWKATSHARAGASRQMLATCEWSELGQ